MELNLNEIAVKQTQNYANRPTIVFLHDSLGCISLWRDFPEKLGELSRCNTLIYDRQGYGKSCSFFDIPRDNFYLEHEADLLLKLLLHWGLDDVILFGHSDGGSIALIAAAKYPEKIRGIITEGAHVFVESITISGIQEAVEIYRTTDLKTKLEKYHSDKTDALFWAWANTWTTNEFRQWNISPFLKNIQCPSLIIQGENDEYGSLKQVEQITSQTTGKSTPLIIPNVKHTPHKEVSDLILKQSTDFIDSLLMNKSV